MKTRHKNLCLLPVLVAALGLILACRLTAQTFTTLYSFAKTDGKNSSGNPITSDGALPVSGLVLSSNILYGTTSGGSSSGDGIVFALNTDGTGFTNLHAFSGVGDGSQPKAPLILSANTLYGTAEHGGSSSNGTVFAVNTDGTSFRIVHNFTAQSCYPCINSDGAWPVGGLILSSNTLYGTTMYGGSSGNGTVFSVNTNGTGFTNLHSFTGGSDGYNPDASLVLSGSTLFGTTSSGTIFAINPDGTGFRTVHSFSSTSIAGLTLMGNTLYGTTMYGGSSGNGTVFAVNTDGTGFTNMHSFSGGSGGAAPEAGLVLSGNTLYGTAAGGVSSSFGTVFAVKTDGTAFVALYSFTHTSGFPYFTNRDGSLPEAPLILSGNTLYGTAELGGSGGNGTVFSLSLPLQLTIIPAAANVVLMWPTNATGFALQSTTNLGSSAIWTTNFPAPVVVNGLYTVTNPISGTQQYYRLSQ